MGKLKKKFIGPFQYFSSSLINIVQEKLIIYGEILKIGGINKKNSSLTRLLNVFLGPCPGIFQSSCQKSNGVDLPNRSLPINTSSTIRKTHIKNVFFSGRTTKVLPSLH